MNEKYPGARPTAGTKIDQAIRRDHPGVAEFDKLAERKANEKRWLHGKLAVEAGEILDVYPWQDKLNAEQKDFLVRAVIFEMDQDHESMALAKRAFGDESSEAASEEAKEQVWREIEGIIRRVASKPQFGLQMPGPAVVIPEKE